jgi:hypothetical protein
MSLAPGPYIGTALAAEPAQLLPARQQMAFTLAFHIVLVPFGVAFTAMILIANYIPFAVEGSFFSWRPSSWPSTSTAGGAFVPGHTC